ncbi:MAG: MFS transporter [Pseudomonadota bacterium]
MADMDATRESGSEAKVSASSYSWYVLGILFLVYVLNFIDRQIISILANDIKADLGLTDADLGFLYGTAFAVFYALFGIPFGKLADSWNRTWLMTLGLSLWSAMTAFSGLAQNGVMLAAARLGVGIGEATASPSAYSLISDWFPKQMRATALAIYSAGLYLGGGISLAIGGVIVEQWNAAYPGGGALGLVGWQVAFMAVGIPGLLLAVWVYSLREPVRGAIDGIPAKPVDKPFAGFLRELFAIIPPFTLLSAARVGGRTLTVNLFAAAAIALIAFGLIRATGSVLQWIAVGIGYYAIVSWADTLRTRDAPTFKLIWGTPAFLYTILGYGCVAFISYSISFWAAPYAERVLGESKSVIGLIIGGGGALGGFLGVIIGGRISDWLRERNPSGRVLVIAFGLLAPVIPILIAFTTTNVPLFYALNFVNSLLGSSALGAAAATTQDLVLPRMRGVATATFFLATTLFALALGPYMAGYVSTVAASLSTGILSVLIVAPLGTVMLILAYRAIPIAEEQLVERAKSAGEVI